MNRSTCSLLVCGASFAGIGAAKAALEANRDVIVVERTALPGREFIEAFNPGAGWKPPATEFGLRFREELLGRNLMEEYGPAHLAALHPLLCLLVKRYSIRVRFLTELVDVSRRDGRFEVMLHDASGSHTVVADTILDTSTRRLTTPGSLAASKRKWMRAYLHHPDIRNAPLPEPIDDTMSASRGRFPSEAILRMEIAPDEGPGQARRRLYAYWEARPAPWKLWTIAAIAGEFESDVPQGPFEQGDGWSWLPSEALSNPLNALDAGYDYMNRKAVRMRDATTK
ncbi:hypothetical protein [Paenibacillus sp. GYB003]|uniref:hypothetical protein n=1 Tax=Paenibacillus sp. GYB003 TaxID=2994392 RepID=UPI002F96AF58